MHSELLKKNPCCGFCQLITRQKSLSIPGKVISYYQNIFKAPLDFSKDKISMHTNSIGWVLRILTSSAVGLVEDLRLIHVTVLNFVLDICLKPRPKEPRMN